MSKIYNVICLTCDFDLSECFYIKFKEDNADEKIKKILKTTCCYHNFYSQFNIIKMYNPPINQLFYRKNDSNKILEK